MAVENGHHNYGSLTTPLITVRSYQSITSELYKLGWQHQTHSLLDEKHNILTSRSSIVATSDIQPLLLPKEFTRSLDSPSDQASCSIAGQRLVKSQSHVNVIAETVCKIDWIIIVHVLLSVCGISYKDMTPRDPTYHSSASTKGRRTNTLWQYPIPGRLAQLNCLCIYIRYFECLPY